LLDAVKAGADVPGLMEQVQTMILEEMPMSVVFHRDVATTWRKNEVDGARPLQNGLVDLRTLAPIGS